MKILFTKSSSPVSKLIRWIFNEPISHLAIEMDERIVYHSNLIGVHLNWASRFRAHCEVVFEINIPMKLEQEELVYQRAIPLEGSSWDWTAGFWLFYRGLLFKWFKKPMPKYNPWSRKQRLFCHELAMIFSGLIPIPDYLDTLTPYTFYLILTEVAKNGTIHTP